KKEQEATERTEKRGLFLCLLCCLLFRLGSKELQRASRTIWWGVSALNRKHGLPRIDHLRAAPARVCFLSIEPLLEDLGPHNLEGIHWVIAGGESGPGARPLEKAWVLSIRDQCQAAGVPFFFKHPQGQGRPRTRRQDVRCHAGTEYRVLSTEYRV